MISHSIYIYIIVWTGYGRLKFGRTCQGRCDRISGTHSRQFYTWIRAPVGVDGFFTPVGGPAFESLQFLLPNVTQNPISNFPVSPAFSDFGMASGARWGSPEVSWANSCLVEDGSDGADSWISPNNDFGVRNAPPAWIPSPCEDLQEVPILTISPLREAAQRRADEVFRAWNWNPLDFDEDFAVFSLLDAEEPLDIFPTWDLNTQSPRGPDDDVLEFLARTVAHSDQNRSPPEDGSDLGVNPDVFDLNALSSTLEEEPALESLIAGMAELNIAVSSNF